MTTTKAKAPRKNTKASQRKFVAVHLDSHLYIALRDSAKASNRTVAGQLRSILTDVYGGEQ